MKRIIRGAGLLMAVSLLAFGQADGTTPKFEVASIKPAPPPSGNGLFIRMGGDAGRLDYANVSLKDYIRVAYGVKSYQVSGPDWLESTRFNIVAKLPDGAAPSQMPEMLQALLAERFKLTLHREKKELPVYAVVVGKNGPKMKEVEPIAPGPGGPGGTDGPGGPGGVRRFGGPGGPGSGPGGPGGMGRGRIQIGGGKLELSAMSMSNFCEHLSRFVDRPVVDMTELKGLYDFKLQFSPELGDRAMQKMAMAGGLPPGGPRPGASPDNPPDPNAPSIFTAVQEQLGLKLDGRKAPIDILVIDHIEKVPTEN